MQAREYYTEDRGNGVTAVIKVGAQGGRKTIAVYDNFPHADALTFTLNNFKKSEA